jgi:hypothetical protein
LSETSCRIGSSAVKTAQKFEEAGILLAIEIAFDYYYGMVVTEQINSKLQKLPTLYQQEVLHFIEFLSQKAMRDEAETEEKLWTDFSLTQAIRGLEDDDTPEYTEADLKEKWR